MERGISADLPCHLDGGVSFSFYILEVKIVLGSGWRVWDVAAFTTFSYLFYQTFGKIIECGKTF